MKKKRLSPFSKEFWVQKGYTDDEAEYKRNSIKPIRKEYWLEKGYSEQLAIQKAEEIKDINNKKGAKASASRTNHRETSVRCIEYWINKGCSLEDAKEQVRLVQATNTLETYQKKYGTDLGKKKFEERKAKWSKEIEKQSPDRNAINYKKLFKKYKSNFKIANLLNESRGMNLVLTTNDFDQVVRSTLKEKPDLYYSTPEKLCRVFPRIQYQLLDIKNPKDFMKKYVNGSGGVYKSNSYGYRKWHGNSLLRSSSEIRFAELLEKHSISFECEGRYPDSNQRYDFLVGDKYVEISPMYGKDKGYTKKINQKIKDYGCIVLINEQDFVSFINSVKKEDDESQS